jgi:hypothetical protein
MGSLRWIGRARGRSTVSFWQNAAGAAQVGWSHSVAANCGAMTEKTQKGED